MSDEAKPVVKMEPLFLPGVENNPQPGPYTDALRTMQTAGPEYPQIWHLRGKTGGQNGTHVPSGRGEQSTARPLHRRPADDADSGPGVPADLAPVRIQTGGDRPPGALHTGDHARTGPLEPLVPGIDQSRPASPPNP